MRNLIGENQLLQDLALICPECSNHIRFHGTVDRQQMIWCCDICGNDKSFKVAYLMPPIIPDRFQLN